MNREPVAWMFHYEDRDGLEWLKAEQIFTDEASAKANHSLLARSAADGEQVGIRNVGEIIPLFAGHGAVPPDDKRESFQSVHNPEPI